MIVFMFNVDGSYLGSRHEDSNYQLSYGETLVAPDLLINPTFDGAKWIGSTVETETSVIDKQLAAISYQQMTTTQGVTTLQTQNAQMAYQLMTQGGATA